MDEGRRGPDRPRGLALANGGSTIPVSAASATITGTHALNAPAGSGLRGIGGVNVIRELIRIVPREEFEKM